MKLMPCVDSQWASSRYRAAQLTSSRSKYRLAHPRQCGSSTNGLGSSLTAVSVPRQLLYNSQHITGITVPDGASLLPSEMSPQHLPEFPQQRPRYVPAPDAQGRAKQLTADISHKRHWSQLQNTWLDNADHFQPIHLCATLCRLARIARQHGFAASDRPEVFKFSSALLSAVQQCIPDLDPRGLAQGIWAYAALQTAAPHSSSSGDAAAAALAAALLLQGSLYDLQPAQLSQAAWGAATLQAKGMVLPAGWWAAVERRTLQLLPLLKPSEVACCAWAATHSGRCLSCELAAALQELLAAAAEGYGPRELLQVMLALGGASAGMQQQQQQQQQQAHLPQQQHHQQQQQQAHQQLAAAHSRSSTDRHWLVACYSSLLQHAPCLSAREVSTALLALSRLGVRNTHSNTHGNTHSHAPHPLPVALSTRLLRRALDTMPGSSPRALAMLAYALARLELNPGPWWWASCLPYTVAALHACSPSLLAVLAWSMAKAGVHPGQGWIQELLQHSGFKMQGFGAQEVTMLMHALGKWHASPGAWWWAAYEDATQGMASYFTAAELAALLSGMGNTGPLPLEQHCPQLQQPQQAGYATFCSHLPGSAAAAPAAAEYIPSGAWSASVLQAAHGALSGAPAGALGGMAMGLGKLGIHPSPTWLDAFQGAALSALQQATLQEVAAVLWGLAVLQVQPSRALVQAVDTRITLLTAFEPAAGRRAPARRVSPVPAAVNAAAAPEQWQQWSRLLGPSAVTPAQLLSAPLVGSRRPSAAVAAQLLWSAARLPMPEGVAAWADDLLAAVCPTLQYASPRTLVVLLRALAWLKHTPGQQHWLNTWWQAYAAHLPQGQPSTHTPSRAAAAAVPRVCGSTGALVDEAAALQQQQECDGGMVPEALHYSHAAEQLCYQLTVVLWCFKRLGVHRLMHTSWLAALAATTQPLLVCVSRQRFSRLLQQMAQLHVWPGQDWLAAAEAALLLHFPDSSAPKAQQAAVSLWMLGGHTQRL